MRLPSANYGIHYNATIGFLYKPVWLRFLSTFWPIGLSILIGWCCFPPLYPGAHMIEATNELIYIDPIINYSDTTSNKNQTRLHHHALLLQNDDHLMADENTQRTDNNSSYFLNRNQDQEHKSKKKKKKKQKQKKKKKKKRKRKKKKMNHKPEPESSTTNNNRTNIITSNENFTTYSVVNRISSTRLTLDSAIDLNSGSLSSVVSRAIIMGTVGSFGLIVFIYFVCFRRTKRPSLKKVASVSESKDSGRLPKIALGSKLTQRTINSISGSNVLTVNQQQASLSNDPSDISDQSNTNTMDSSKPQMSRSKISQLGQHYAIKNKFLPPIRGSVAVDLLKNKSSQVRLDVLNKVSSLIRSKPDR